MNIKESLNASVIVGNRPVAYDPAIIGEDAGLALVGGTGGDSGEAAVYSWPNTADAVNGSGDTYDFIQDGGYDPVFNFVDVDQETGADQQPDPEVTGGGLATETSDITGITLGDAQQSLGDSTNDGSVDAEPVYLVMTEQGDVNPPNSDEGSTTGGDGRQSSPAAPAEDGSGESAGSDGAGDDEGIREGGCVPTKENPLPPTDGDGTDPGVPEGDIVIIDDPVPPKEGTYTSTVSTDENGNIVNSWDYVAGDYTSHGIDTYDADSHLLNSTWADSNGNHGTTVYGTDSDGNMVVSSEIGDASGYTSHSTTTYGPDGSLLSSSWSDSNGNYGHSMTATDADGNTVYSDEGGNADGYTSRSVVTYGSDGHLVSSVSSWLDGAGNHGSSTITTDADGNTVYTNDYSYADGQTYQNTATYSPDGHFVSSGSSWSDSAGNHGSTMSSTDADGNVVEVSEYGSADGNTIQTRAVYTPDGHLVSSSGAWTDSLGNHGSTTASTEADGNVVYHNESSNSEGYTYWSVDTYNADGQLLSSTWTDSNGNHGEWLPSDSAEVEVFPVVTDDGQAFDFTNIQPADDNTDGGIAPVYEDGQVGLAVEPDDGSNVVDLVVTMDAGYDSAYDTGHDLTSPVLASATAGDFCLA